jgi:hypothetical protein
MDEKEEKQMTHSDALAFSKGDANEFKDKLKLMKYDFDTQDDNGKNKIK